jgi:hypothetical protein
MTMRWLGFEDWPLRARRAALRVRPFAAQFDRASSAILLVDGPQGAAEESIQEQEEAP